MSDSKMETIQGLLNNAESFEREGQADVARNYREKAERMMAKYAIDEAMLASKRMAEGVADNPEQRTFTFASMGSPLVNQYYNLMIQIAEHNRCKFFGYSEGYGYLMGYPKDMDFTEMLYTSVRLQMMNKVEPTPSLEKSYDENVWFLHECGVKWENIAQHMNRVRLEWLEANGHHFKDLDVPGEPWPWTPWDEKKKDGGRLIRACKRWCKENDLPYQSISSPDVHLRSYALGYLHTVADRLRALRAHQEDEIKSTSGAELVLVGRQGKVDAMFEEMTRDIKLKRDTKKINTEGYIRGSQDGRNADLSGGRNNVGRTSKELS